MTSRSNSASRGLPPALIVICSLLAAAVQAQDDVPNFSGVWTRTGGGGGGMGARAQVTAEAQVVMDAYDLFTQDPAYECSPSSLMRGWANPTPIEIEQRDDVVFIRFEFMDVERPVYVDGRALPENPEPNVVGHSIGRYEGSTLIIESAGFSESYVSPVQLGIPQTETLRTTERLTLSEDGQSFHHELTHEDPATFTAPWTMARTFGRRGDLTLLEYGCVLEDAGYEDYETRER